MLTKGLIEAVMFVAQPLIEKLPTISFSESGFAVVASWVNGILYFLPMQTVSMILALMLATFIYRIVISVLKTIWAVLPIL